MLIGKNRKFLMVQLRNERIYFYGVCDVAYSFFHTENALPGKERVQLPSTVDRDDEDEEEKKTSQVCYFILSDKSTNNSLRFFHVDPVTHILSAKVKLDREKQSNHTLIIFATEDCHVDVSKIDISKMEETSLLRVKINVVDVNDNAYVFFIFVLE